MMRRSLALGALMAFVITGSAMAAEYDGSKFGYGTSGVLNEESITINSVTQGMYCSNWNLTASKEIKIFAQKEGLRIYGNIKLDSVDITIDSDGDGIYFQDDGSEAKLEITGFDNLTIDSATGYAIANHATSAKELKIIGNTGSTIDLTSYERPVIGSRAGEAQTVIEAGTLNVYGDTDNKYNSIIYATVGADMNITADKLTITNTETSDNTDRSNDAVIRVEAGTGTENDGTNLNLNVKEITIDAYGARGIDVRNDIPTSGTNEEMDADKDVATLNLGNENTEKITINNADIGIYVKYQGSNVVVEGKELKINSVVDGNGSDTGIWVMNNQYKAGEDANGRDIEDPAQLTIGKNTKTVITMKDENGDAAGIGIAATSQANVDIAGDLEVVAEDAIYTRGNAVTKINEDGGSTVVLIGNINYDSSDNVKDASVLVNLDNAQSKFVGSVISNDKNDVVTGTTLGLSNGATWNVTGDSFVNELTGTDGNVVLKYEGTTDDGVDVAQVDIGENNNENLTVSGDEALTKAIEDGTVDATAALNALNDAVTTTDENNKEVAAANTVKTAEGKILGSYVLNNEGKAELQESSMSAAVSEAGMNLKAHWRAHMNDMNKRMGELRFANGEHGIWTRMVRGESEYEGAKMQYNQYQMGYDEKLSVDKRWTVGAAVTFSEGDSSYGQGSTDDKSTAFAIYGSKLNNDGTFVDLIARYARLESDIEDSVYKNGEYDTNGMSVSAEFGKRIQQGNGLWIEPQVELTYGTVDSASVRFDDGSVANYGDMDSFIGRVGFSLGKDIKQGNVYARASYLYDFDGETETTFTNGKVSGKPVEEDFGGGWWEVGVGTNINLSKATYIYADVEKTFGGEVDTNWKWNLGVRYSF